MLSALGVEVVDERPYEIRAARASRRGSTTSGCAPDSGRRDAVERRAALFQDAFLAVWQRQAESDGFNALVLARG